MTLVKERRDSQPKEGQNESKEQMLNGFSHKCHRKKQKDNKQWPMTRDLRNVYRTEFVKWGSREVGRNTETGGKCGIATLYS